jgi:hypothetical protein
MKLKAFAAAAGILFLTGSIAQANLITNGGFEDPVLASGVFYQNMTSSFPGWTVTTNNVDIVNPIVGWGAPAAEGQQVLDLVGYGSTGGIASTSFATTPGATYSFAFAYANNPGFSPASASYSVSDSNNQSLLGGTVIHGTSGNGNLNWNYITGTFTADTATSYLQFTEILGGGNAGILLDDVKVAPVPEPSTWAMLLLGFAGVGLMAYRRRDKPSIRLA